MEVIYIGEEGVGNFIIGKTYVVIDVLEIGGEKFYLTKNNEKDKWYFKAKLFEIIEK